MKRGFESTGLGQEGRDFEGDGQETGEREWRLAEGKLPLLTRRGEYPKETWFRFVQSVQLVATPNLEPRIASITRHQTTTFRSAAGENRTMGPRMAFRTGGRAQQDCAPACAFSRLPSLRGRRPQTRLRNSKLRTQGPAHPPDPRSGFSGSRSTRRSLSSAEALCSVERLAARSAFRPDSSL